MKEPSVARELSRNERPAVARTMPPDASLPEDETLIADDRAGLTPSQFVETKLRHLLSASVLPLSCLQTASSRGRRTSNG